MLGAEQVGIYNYTYSIAQYFVIFGTLGLDIYGNRQIAYSSRNPQKMHKDFWSIITIRLITTSIALIVFWIMQCRNGKYYHLYLLQSIYIVSAMIDITWYFKGQEDFKTVVTRNLIIRIISVALTFIFVKSKEDIDTYIVINAGTMLIGNMSLWPLLRGKIKFTKVQYGEVAAHFIPIMALFIPQIAGQIYCVLDKFMLGIMSSMLQVGYYSQTQKIQRAILALVTTLGTVMLPRMSAIYASGDEKKLNEHLNQSLCGVALVTIPISIGLATVSSDFVPLFLGDDFINAVPVMEVLSPVIIVIALSNVSGVQYLLPANRTKQYTISVFAGALTNVVLNSIFIPDYGAVGAAVATLIAEIVVLLVQMFCIRRAIVFNNLFVSGSKYLISSAIMATIVVLIKYCYLNINIWLRLILEVNIGICTYAIMLFILKDQLFITLTKYIKERIFRN